MIAPGKGCSRCGRHPNESRFICLRSTRCVTRTCGLLCSIFTKWTCCRCARISRCARSVCACGVGENRSKWPISYSGGYFCASASRSVGFIRCRTPDPYSRPPHSPCDGPRDAGSSRRFRVNTCLKNVLVQPRDEMALQHRLMVDAEKDGDSLGSIRQQGLLLRQPLIALAARHPVAVDNEEPRRTREVAGRVGEVKAH